MLGTIVQKWRLLGLQRQGAKIELPCVLGASSAIGTRSLAGRNGTVSIGAHCDLGRGVELSPWGGDIRIGKHVFIGPYVVIYGHGGVDVGDHSLISMHCCILSSDHTVPGRKDLIRDKADKLLPTRIGRDVWLGAGAKILGGVNIGDGCVVGAGAVVSEDLRPYSIAVGVPARVISRRD